MRRLESAGSISSFFPASRIMPPPINWISIKHVSRQQGVYNLDAPCLTSELGHFLRRRLGRRAGVGGCGSGEPAGVGRVGLGRDGTVPSRFGCLAVWNYCYGQSGVSTGSRAGGQHGVGRLPWDDWNCAFKVVPRSAL